MLYLYNYAPNKNNNIHYYFKSTSTFLNFMDTYLKLRVQNDSYSFIDGFVKIYHRFDGIVPEEDFEKLNICYIYDDIGNKFYHIKNLTFLQQTTAELNTTYAILNCQIYEDLWANYLPYATISDIFVKRANVNLGQGIYDPIQNSSTIAYRQIIEDPSESELAVVFTACYTVQKSSSLFNESAITSVKTYCISYNTLLSKSLIKTGFNAGQTFQNIVSAIKGIKAKTIFGFDDQLDCAILHAYLVHYNAIPITAHQTNQLPTFIYASADSSSDLEIVPDFEVKSSRNARSFAISTELNKIFYGGTKNNALKLPRFTQSFTLRYEFLFKQDGMQVFVRAGEYSRDITQAFEINLTTNAGNITSNERIANTINSLSGGFEGGISISQGKVLEGAGKIFNSISEISPKSNAGFVYGGDGLFAFYGTNENANTYTSFPYLQVFTSTSDESKLIQENGATFNTYIENLDALFQTDFLVSETSFYYVECDCRIDNIFETASDYIRKELQNGCKLVQISDNLTDLTDL